MNTKQNLNIYSNICESIKYIALEEMLKAGDEELRPAKENENINVDGKATFTVIADGQWAKRSYKKKSSQLR